MLASSQRPNRQVVRYCRRTRRQLGVVARGITADSAHDLIAALQSQPGYDEAAFGYMTRMLPLSEQVELMAAAETMSALRRAA